MMPASFRARASRCVRLATVVLMAISLVASAALAQGTGRTPAKPASPKPAPPPLPEVRWLRPGEEQIAVHGLPWFAANDGRLVRLPRKAKETYRPAVWGLAQSPSGGRLRFRTDTQVLALKLEYPGPPNMANMHAFGQTGVDIYIDDLCVQTLKAEPDAKRGQVSELLAFDFSSEPRKEREITIYLPLYKGLTLHGVGLDPMAKTQPARPFAVAKPVVFYGTSITQGGVASRPGMSYAAIVGRMLNLDHVNLGFSGNGLGEPEVARAVAEVDASCFVLDFAANHRTFDDLEPVYRPFLDAIRAKHPTTPIVCMTPIFTTREARSDLFKKDWDHRRRFIAEIVQERVKAGDAHIVCVQGTDLLGPARADGLADGSHPNDLGFHWMAEGLAPVLKRILLDSKAP